MPSSNPVNWFEIIKVGAEIFLPLVAIVISVIAIRQTKKQTELGNKHQLFERRLEKYYIIEALISSFYLSRAICDKESDMEEYPQLILQDLLNNEYLEDAMWVTDKPQEEATSEIIEHKKRWLSMISEEILIIFDNEEAKVMSQFVNQFGTVIFYLNSYIYWNSYLDEEEKQNAEKERAYKHYQLLDRLAGQIEDEGTEYKILDQVKLL